MRSGTDVRHLTPRQYSNIPLPCNGGTSGGGVSTHYFPDNIYTRLRTIEFRRGVAPRSDRLEFRLPALLPPHNSSPNKDWASFNNEAGYAYAGPPSLSFIHLHHIIMPHRLPFINSVQSVLDTSDQRLNCASNFRVLRPSCPYIHFHHQKPIWVTICKVMGVISAATAL